MNSKHQDSAQVQATAQELLVKLRADTLSVFQIFSLIPLLYYTYRTHLVGMDVAFYGVLVGLANNLANIWLLRRSPWPHLAAPIYISGLYVMVAGVAFVDNLLESPVLWFVFMGPVLAALTMGVRAVKINAGISFAVIALVAVCEFSLTGLPVREHPPAVLWIMRIVGIVMLSGFGLIASWRALKQERKIAAQNEIQEQARAKVEAAAVSKSEFLATMSHEIRTPMNGILGTAQLLAGSQLGETQQGYTTVILDSGRQLMDVLNAILDLSKIEAMKFELRDAKVRLDRVFRDVIREVGQSVYAQHVEVKAVGGQQPMMVQGDPSRIEQVLRNLLTAVVQYASGGELVVQLETQGDSARIEIRLPGQELASSELAVLEEPGLALSLRPSESQRIALAMKVSHAIVALMGGALVVESDPEQGTVLKWFLCKGALELDCELSLSTGSRLEVSVESWDSQEVLVVDDNAINLRVARMQLEQMGCEVTVANNGAEAIERCGEIEFAAIFMDLQMPELSGVDTTKIIRSSHGPNAQTPIIAFTADAYDADLAALEAVGMNGHLTKPFRVESLRRVLSKLQGPVLQRKVG